MPCVSLIKFILKYFEIFVLLFIDSFPISNTIRLFLVQNHTIVFKIDVVYTGILPNSLITV